MSECVCACFREREQVGVPDRGVNGRTPLAPYIFLKSTLFGIVDKEEEQRRVLRGTGEVKNKIDT